MNDVVFVITNSKLAKKKETRKPNRINIDDCSYDEEWIMKDEHEHNEPLDLDENLILIEVEEDETLHSQDIDMADFNDEGDGNDGVKHYEFNLEDYLV